MEVMSAGSIGVSVLLMASTMLLTRYPLALQFHSVYLFIHPFHSRPFPLFFCLHLPPFVVGTRLSPSMGSLH